VNRHQGGVVVAFVGFFENGGREKAEYIRRVGK
jgi:hypothetical protein